MWEVGAGVDGLGGAAIKEELIDCAGHGEDKSSPLPLP